MLRIIGRVAAGGLAKSVVYRDFKSDNTDTSAYSFAGCALGDASAQRHIIVGVEQNASLGVTNVVQVAGVAATQVANDGIAFPFVSLWIAAVPTGTTGTITASTTDQSLGMTIVVWSAYALVSSTPFATGNAKSTAPTLNMNMPAGGIVCAIAREYDTGTGGFGWSGGTLDNTHEDVDAEGQSTVQVAAASRSNLTAATPGTITVQHSTSNFTHVVAASWS